MAILWKKWQRIVCLFGKYKGHLIIKLPEHYLVWFSSKGFPQGKLGQMLSTMYEIKLNGLEYLLKPYLNR